jgi:uncharacterized delta-60 repeat protein
MSGHACWRTVLAFVLAVFVVLPCHVGAEDLDLAFGNGGRVITNVSGRYAIRLNGRHWGAVVTDFSGGSDAAWAVAIQPDGKIVAAGVANGGFALARYSQDGSLESQFGTGGKLTVDFGSDDKVSALALQPDGKIVAVGSADRLDFAIARVNGDGALDATFGNEGTVITDFNDNNDSALAVAIQPDGKIVAAGYVRSSSGADFDLVRYPSYR